LNEYCEGNRKAIRDVIYIYIWYVFRYRQVPEIKQQYIFSD
jgi:hypothetical protein